MSKSIKQIKKRLNKKYRYKQHTQAKYHNIIFSAFFIATVTIGVAGVQCTKEIEKNSYNPILTPILKHETNEIVKLEPKQEKTPTKENLIKRVRETAKKYCDLKDFGAYCINDLEAMVYTETRFKKNCGEVGDNGNAFGCFQIHLIYNKEVTKEQANDLDFATNWTLERMVNFGYPIFRSRAIRKHNGSATNPKTKLYLDTVNNYIKK